jgi:hypothetical protein
MKAKVTRQRLATRILVAWRVTERGEGAYAGSFLKIGARANVLCAAGFYFSSRSVLHHGGGFQPDVVAYRSRGARQKWNLHQENCVVLGDLGAISFCLRQNGEVVTLFECG